jgi:sugar phosphate permease
VLPATLVVVMVAGVFQMFFFAILAAPLIDDVGMSRTELGIIGSLNTLVGALTAPYTGRVADAIGPGRAVVGTLVVSAAGMSALALAPSLLWIYVAAAIGGIPQGASNPATNALISTRVPVGGRGTLTGIKQSGVTLATFLAGISLPALEATYGWRGASWTFAGLFLLVAAVVQVSLATDASRTVVPTVGADVPVSRLDPVIVWIAAYAFFMGLAAGAIGRFLPLFAEETLGFSVGTAGLIAALGGLLGVAARIWAGHVAEHRIRPVRLLPALSLVGAAFAVLLAVTTPTTRGLLWLSPPLSAIGTNAWNAVAMLAVIMMVSTASAGKASGVVMFGFLGGMAVAGPVTGAVVDQTGSYRPVWIAAAIVSLVAAAIMVTFERRSASLLRRE